MEFEKFLSQERATILDRWFHRVVETYPPQTANLLIKEKNEFANPVGHSIRQGIKGLFEGLLHGMDEEKVVPFLDQIIRIRAVQDFSPAKAIAFVFLLKQIIREESLKEAWKDKISSTDLLAFESRIDEMALLAFNVYMACREKLYEVRVNEVKNRTYRLLQRANLLAEIPDAKPGPLGENISNQTSSK